MTAETEVTLFVHIVRVEFRLSGFPNNVIHVSGFCCEDGDFGHYRVQLLAT
jgi:hypothetical protein